MRYARQRVQSLQRYERQVGIRGLIRFLGRQFRRNQNAVVAQGACDLESI